MSWPFRWPVRVYWEDTDAGGLVYHAAYLKFFERARSEWLRAQGLGQRQLAAKRGLLFVVRQMQIDWLRPARLDDLLELELEIRERRRASLSFSQRMLRMEDHAVLCTALVRVACLDAARLKPCPIPADLFSGPDR